MEKGYKLLILLQLKLEHSLLTHLKVKDRVGGFHPSEYCYGKIDENLKIGTTTE